MIKKIITPALRIICFLFILTSFFEFPKVVAAPSSDEKLGVDLGPEEDAEAKDLYARPPGPAQGGTMKVPHPGAAKGLIRINKDGSYQYRTKLKPKSKAMSFRFGPMTPPEIQGKNSSISFRSMYGSSSLFLIQGDYEWSPFRKYGPLGVLLGAGLTTASGNGTLATGQAAEEKYNLIIVPLSAFGVYRFEYARRQWVVPYLIGGGTYFGLVEKRDDDQAPTFAGTWALGGGGGVHFSLSRMDPGLAFNMEKDYGIADSWITLEARAMQGLDAEFDFTTQMITLGITMDY